LHPWTSRIDKPELPTYALIDLDPGSKTTWDELLVLARLHRTALGELGVEAFPKTSGQRGLQIWIPIRRGPTFDETRAWVERLSHIVGRVVPDLVSWAWEKRSREGRARLDYTQNAINKTLVAPFSVRAAAGATVSMPLEWRDLDDRRLRSDRWTVRDAVARLRRRHDPMARALTTEQDLPPLG
jgi:bifunctional non-homologous end joining protein LigD